MGRVHSKEDGTFQVRFSSCIRKVSEAATRWLRNVEEEVSNLLTGDEGINNFPLNRRRLNSVECWKRFTASVCSSIISVHRVPDHRIICMMKLIH